MSIYAEIAPVYVTGDFSLEPAPTGWVVREPVNTLKPGSWKEQGMACYSWDVSYSKTYRIEDTSARYALQLNKWKGTVAEVFVNGQKAGVIAYQPYNFDLSPYLKKGIINRSKSHRKSAQPVWSPLQPRPGHHGTMALERGAETGAGM